MTNKENENVIWIAEHCFQLGESDEIDKELHQLSKIVR